MGKTLKYGSHDFPKESGFTGSTEKGKHEVRFMARGGRAKVGKVMGEFKRGELHSGSKTGPKVTNPAQAKAIAMSEAGLSKAAGGAIPRIRPTPALGALAKLSAWPGRADYKARAVRPGGLKKGGGAKKVEPIAEAKREGPESRESAFQRRREGAEPFKRGGFPTHRSKPMFGK